MWRVVLVLVALFCFAQPTYAEQRTPPQATAHALDEIANALAQGKITATPTATATPVPPTATPTPVPPTATPDVINTPEPTPTPGLPVVSQDDPLQGYLRPSSRDASWLELALPQGRWDVQANCVMQPWDTVWLWDDYETSTAYLNDCQLFTWIWSSDTPCSQNEDGICDSTYDLSYWDWLGHQPTPIPTAIPPTAIVPTPVPIPVKQQSAPAPQPAPRAVPAQPQVVIQTVVVTEQPAATTTPLATVTKTPIVTTTPTATTTATHTATVTTVPTVTEPTPTPSVQQTPSEAVASWVREPVGLLVIALLIIISVVGVIWFMHKWNS